MRVYVCVCVRVCVLLYVLLTAICSLPAQEAHVYEDPVTKFLLSAYVDFDFDAAQLHLKESIEVNPRVQRELC